MQSDTGHPRGNAQDSVTSPSKATKEEIEMTNKEKAKVMDSWEVANRINDAKDAMDRAVEQLENKGLYKDAETLSRMIFRLEKFQNKYNQW